MRKLEIMLLSQLHDIGPSTQARLVDANRDTDWLEVVLTLSELIEEGYIKPFAYQGEEIPEEGIQRNTPPPNLPSRLTRPGRIQDSAA